MNRDDNDEYLRQPTLGVFSGRDPKNTLERDAHNLIASEAFATASSEKSIIEFRRELRGPLRKFIKLCGDKPPSRELSIAKTHAETALLWADQHIAQFRAKQED